MKVTTPTVQTSTGDRRRADAAARRVRRMQRRLDRADRHFARTERVVEATVARVIAAEQAVETVLADPTVTEISIDGLTVGRGTVPEVLAMAQHDLRVALRRHADAASRVCRCLSALPATGDLVSR